jgi:type I restriction enzyme S subunit
MICKLKDISIDKRGYYGIGASAVNYDKDKYTYLRITDINDDGSLNEEGLMSVDDENASKYLLEKNDIVFARTGASTGRNYFYDGEIKNLVYAGFLIKFSLDEKKVNPKFIKYYCLSKKYKDWIRASLTGSTRPNINEKQLSEMPIILPNMNCQNKFVEIMDSLTNKIKLNNEINNNLYEIINSIFKERFSNEDNYKRADEIANITIGKTPPRGEHECFSTNDNDIKWVSISDLGKCGMYIYDTNEKLTQDAVNKYNVKIVPANTILLSFKLTVGRIAITTQNMVTNEAIAHFNLNDGDYMYYIYSYLNNFDYSKLGSTSSIATAVNSKIIKSMNIAIPDKNDVLDYNNKVIPIFDKIKNNEEENQVLEKLRDTLLPKLMNGEIDLDNTEI